MHVHTPRHMRKRYRRLGGASGDEKSQIMRRRARVAKQFIRLSASALAGPHVSGQYARWCAEMDAVNKQTARGG